MAAVAAFDFERARALLADRGFQFRSPIARFDSADQMIQYRSHTDGIIQSVEVRKVFVDGPDVCHILRYRVQLSEKLSIDAVQWAHVEGDRIQRMETLFDASSYRELFPVPPGLG